MPFLQPFLIAALLPVLGASEPPVGNLTGNWPVTISQSQFSNGTDCLTLKDDGSLGWPHSGYASAVIGGTKFPYGTFQVIDHTLVVTIQAPGYGQNAGLVFTAPVKKNIGEGAYDEVYGGEAFDTGLLVFGTKGGC